MRLLLSHSPSVIKPSQAMGAVRVNKEGEKPMEQYILPSALFCLLNKDIHVRILTSDMKIKERRSKNVERI